jgi:hypothetical protein
MLKFAREANFEGENYFYTEIYILRFYVSLRKITGRGHQNMNLLTFASVCTGEMIRIARKAFDPKIAIGRLLLQKIAFFSQMAGLPIALQFRKYKLGPFDYRLTFNVDRLEGLFVRDASTILGKSDLIILDEEEWLNGS